MANGNDFNYEEELSKLHTELVHLNRWIKKQGLKVIEKKCFCGKFKMAF